MPRNADLISSNTFDVVVPTVGLQIDQRTWSQSVENNGFGNIGVCHHEASLAPVVQSRRRTAPAIVFSGLERIPTGKIYVASGYGEPFGLPAARTRLRSVRAISPSWPSVTLTTSSMFSCS